MSKSLKRLASQSRPLLGRSADLIQSPCSRQRIRIRVSARLQATAAPEAPDPTIKTSTRSLPAMSAFLTCGRAIVAPERRAAADSVEQRPVALFQVVTLGEGSPRLQPQRQQYAIVAVVGGQDHPTEGHRRGAAGLVVGTDQGLPLVAIQYREGAAGLRANRGEGFTNQPKVASHGLDDVGEDGGIVGTGHAPGGAGGDHRPRDVAEVALFRGGECGFGAIVHESPAGVRCRSSGSTRRLARRSTGTAATQPCCIRHRAAAGGHRATVNPALANRRSAPGRDPRAAWATGPGCDPTGRARTGPRDGAPRATWPEG